MAADAGVADGMRSMLARRQAELADGAEPIGWKLGITVPAMQETLGIPEPVVGYLTSWTAIEPGTTVDVSSWTAPMLEPEVAIRVGEDGTVAALAPAIELVDIDLPGGDRRSPAFDDVERVEPILARNVFHRGVVFGAEVETASAADLGCLVLVDGSEAASAAVADDFDETVAFAERFLADHEARLAPGDRIIAGSLTTPLPIAPNSTFEVEIAGLGSVALTFA
jgi:2-oxo-3-hexenedioate decarboxylase